ncbi:MAG: enoyl-CoA hydratase-related protein [Paracoccaceae bacterium]
MSFETIEYSVSDDVAQIRLDRPDRMNALSSVMRRELIEVMTRAPNDARAAVITGNGPGFCAGQDLGDVGSFDQLDLGRTLREEYEPLLRLIYDCPVPTICAVNGAAAGAGANLALAADIVVAAESASFLQAFARIGLIPDAGGTYWLPRLAGHARAMGMCLLAEPVPALKAAEWGLIWECVPDADLENHCLQMAGKLAKGPTAAYRLMKQALRESPQNTLATQLELEADLQAEAGKTRDFMEGVMAFIQKRPAEYQGR